MQKGGITPSLLWMEYCEQCSQNGELPYKSSQFDKYYAEHVHTLADAICYRIIYNAYTIQTEGESMRKRKGIPE